MSGIIEDIGSGGIDWNSSSICGRIRSLSYKLFAILTFVRKHRKAHTCVQLQGLEAERVSHDVRQAMVMEIMGV